MWKPYYHTGSERKRDPLREFCGSIMWFHDTFSDDGDSPKTHALRMYKKHSFYLQRMFYVIYLSVWCLIWSIRKIEQDNVDVLTDRQTYGREAESNVRWTETCIHKTFIVQVSLD